MGLFGGFKAKFTRNATTKVKPQEVVCLRYHIQSEFDAQDAPLPVSNNIKKTEVIRRHSKSKSRKALAKSAIFPDSDTSNTSLSSPIAQKSQSLLNLNGHLSQYDDQRDSITISTTVEMPGNSKGVAISDTKFDKKTEERNGVVAETVAVVTNSHLVATNDHVKTEKREKTILKTFSAYDGANERNNGNLDVDKSTLIFMTQHSETTEKNVENGEDNFQIKFSSASNRAFKAHNLRQDSIEEEEDIDGIYNDHANYYDEDDFQVNVAKHDFNRSFSYSEDEKSYQEEEPMEFTKMGFSSQAASIFFGQDVEPVQPRPRRILLKDTDEDDRRSSGADC